MLKQRITGTAKIRRNMRGLANYRSLSQVKSRFRGWGCSQGEVWTQEDQGTSPELCRRRMKGSFSSCRVKSVRGTSQQGWTGAWRTGLVPLKEWTTTLLESSMETWKGFRFRLHVSRVQMQALQPWDVGLEHPRCWFAVRVNGTAVTSSERCLGHSSYSANGGDISRPVLHPLASWWSAI